jgi:hypothetical protein
MEEDPSMGGDGLDNKQDGNISTDRANFWEEKSAWKHDPLMEIA